MTAPDPEPIAVAVKSCGCLAGDDCDCAQQVAEVADALAWPALVASMISPRRVGWS